MHLGTALWERGRPARSGRKIGVWRRQNTGYSLAYFLTFRWTQVLYLVPFTLELQMMLGPIPQLRYTVCR